jgi:hypothetical protein
MAERAALITVCAAELLLVAHERADEIAGAMQYLEHTSAPWSRLRAAILRYWDDTRHPLPLDLIARERGQQTRQRAISNVWDDLRWAFEQAKFSKLPTGYLTRMHSRLFDVDGPFGRLTPAIASRNADTLLRLLREPELSDLGTLIDRVTVELAPQHTLFEGDRRLNYLSKLERIATVAERLSASPGTGARHTFAIPASANAVMAELTGLWPAMQAAVSASEAPEHQLTRAGLDDLNAIRSAP